MLKGEIENMEAQFPQLKDKALALVGHEVYYELAVL